MTQVSNERLEEIRDQLVELRPGHVRMAQSDVTDLIAGLTELLSLRQSHSTGAVVKGLEWDDEHSGEWIASPIYGQFYIRHADDLYELRLNYAAGADMYQTMIGAFGSLQDARARAEAEHATRIRSTLSALPTGEGEPVAFRWRMSEGDHWSQPHDMSLLPSLFPDDGRIIEYLYTHPKEAEVTDSDLLAAMKKHVGWELDWGPEDRHDEESDFGWRVFERSGGRSDLEWTLLGFGESPRAALVAALSRKG